jgi:hypothetical protein
VSAALESRDDRVRAFAVSLCDAFVGSRAIRSKLAGMTQDNSVQFQLACTLGNFEEPGITRALARLFEKPSDSWSRSALLSSVSGRAIEVAGAIREPDPLTFRPLLESALGEKAPRECVVQLIARAGFDLQVWQLDSLAALLRSDPSDLPGLSGLVAAAEKIAADSTAAERRIGDTSSRARPAIGSRTDPSFDPHLWRSLGCYERRRRGAGRAWAVGASVRVVGENLSCHPSRLDDRGLAAGRPDGGPSFKARNPSLARGNSRSASGSNCLNRAIRKSARRLKDCSARESNRAAAMRRFELMPEGLDQALSVPDMADLIAFPATALPRSHGKRRRAKIVGEKELACGAGIVGLLFAALGEDR